MTDVAGAIDDDGLILQLQRSATRRAAMSTLFRHYAPRFQAYFQRRGLPVASAEDLVQDSFVKLAQASHGFRAQGQGRAWLWQLARSVLLDHLRRADRNAAAPADGGDPEAAMGLSMWSEDESELQGLQDCVQRQFALFTEQEPQRAQVVFWAAVEQLKAPEIARLIGRSPGATREYLSQCRRRLAELLAVCRDYVIS